MMTTPTIPPQLGAAALLLTLVFALGGCSQPDSLEQIQERGLLKVITRNSPTTYFENRGSPTGFEYVLARAFADHLGVELEMVPVYGLEELFIELNKGSFDLAAAGLTRTLQRQQVFEFGPDYMDVQQFVIYRRGNAFAGDIDDLIDKRIMIIGNSSHAEILRELKKDVPELQWEESRNLETTDLLDLLESGDIDFTLLDSNEYLAHRGYYPQHRVAFSVGQPGTLAWPLPPNRDNQRLRAELKQFFSDARDSGLLSAWEERFYGHKESNTQINSQTFVENMESKLPQYRELIEEVAFEYEIDWRLLAAISYQESHWNPRAVSPTGVKGIMMLTLQTAREMGIRHRYDARQSLQGGARYFKKILQRLPDSITNPDRTWFALAAYNIGMGHLEDARVLTEQQGGNPSLWKDVKQRLPLLRQKKWYQKTRRGYARGDEAVRYVQNIRHYYSLLTWTELSRVRIPPPKIVEDYVPERVQKSFGTL